MSVVLLFHHALGVTPGIEAFAADVRAAGHTVVVPDLYEGVTFDSITDGVAHADAIGFDVIINQGIAHADGLGDRFVVMGFSLGVMPAQKLAQTHSGVAGAILCHSAVPISMFGEGWPAAVGLQLHFSEHDPWAEEDLEVAAMLAAESGGELFLYPGSGHLVADSSFTDYDAGIAAQIMERSLAFVDTHG